MATDHFVIYIWGGGASLDERKPVLPYASPEQRNQRPAAFYFRVFGAGLLVLSFLLAPAAIWCLLYASLGLGVGLAVALTVTVCLGVLLWVMQDS